MRKGRIYKIPKSAMQSGVSRSKKWVFEFENKDAKLPDPLMGWVSSSDTTQQVKLYFDSMEEAKKYAEHHNITYSLINIHTKRPKQKSYSDNFRFDRKESWTH